MTKKPDGGMAFPQLEVIAGKRDGHGDAIEAYTQSKGGMTLRDYFAGQIMSGLSVNSHDKLLAFDMASAAYQLADIMIEERNK